MMNDRPCQSTVIRQNSDNKFWLIFFSKIVGRLSNDVQQCPMNFLWRFENIPIITDDIRQRLRCRAYSGLTRSWCYALLYENLLQFLKNNCVVFILIVLHLIYLVFKNFWINIIIETSWKIKADEKHGFLYIFGYGNQHKFSKSTQNSCIIYFRIPVQLE